MVFSIAGIIGGAAAARIGSIVGTSGGYAGKFFSNPIIQGGNFGVGYTTGAYGGYGVTNTWDPFGIHKPKYKHYQQNIKLPYGYYGRSYGRKRYGRYRGYRRRYPYYRRYRY